MASSKIYILLFLLLKFYSVVKLKFSVVLKMLLLVSIVLQSLTAVVSATSQSHQLDIEHIQTQHDHKSDFHHSNDNLEEAEHDIKDCHHCGHCNGSHLSWIVINKSNTATSPFELNKTPYQFVQSKALLDAILRPPISYFI